MGSLDTILVRCTLIAAILCLSGCKEPEVPAPVPPIEEVREVRPPYVQPGSTELPAEPTAMEITAEPLPQPVVPQVQTQSPTSIAAETTVEVVENKVVPLAEATVVTVTSATNAMLDALPNLELPKPQWQVLGIPQSGIDMLIEHEAGSKSLYIRRYQAPVWPGGASGVTWGIGWDGGQQTRSATLSAWASHPNVQELAATSGIQGVAAKIQTQKMQHVITTWDLALEVFLDNSAVSYWKLTQRTYPGFDYLSDNAKSIMLNVTYNRGSRMEGPSRRELKHIRDVCIPAKDYDCISQQLRSMTRLWAGKSPGLVKRYNHTADLMAKEARR